MLNIVCPGFLLKEICNETQADVFFFVFHLARKKLSLLGLRYNLVPPPFVFLFSSFLRRFNIKKRMKGTERKDWVSVTY
jgi:hypothetical protein